MADGMAFKLMGQVPGRMHQPRNANDTVRPQTEVDDRGRQYWIDQLPNTESSADIRTHCACREDGIEAASSGGCAMSKGEPATTYESAERPGGGFTIRQPEGGQSPILRIKR